MLNTDFTVDMSVWQDGVTFRTNIVSRPAADFGTPEALKKTQEQPSFKQVLTQTAVEGNKPSDSGAASNIPAVSGMPGPVSLLPVQAAVQASGVQELPASLANVEDLTPFVVSADSKPGTRLDAELHRTAFKQNRKTENAALPEAKSASPYNMSEEAAAARKVSRPLKGPGDSKMFSMDSVTRYTNTGARPAFNVAQAPESAIDSQKTKLRQLERNIRQREADSSETKIVPGGTKAPAPVDVAALRAQAASDIGYKRESLPSVSSEKTSAAASWFPEAMTRSLDMYEAMKH